MLKLCQLPPDRITPHVESKIYIHKDQANSYLALIWQQLKRAGCNDLERNLVDHSNYINVLEDYVTRHTQGEIEKGVGGS